jgi:hypothetical protein
MFSLFRDICGSLPCTFKCICRSPFCGGRILVFYVLVVLESGHAIAQWLRHYAASRKVAGSSHDEVNFLKLT